MIKGTESMLACRNRGLWVTRDSPERAVFGVENGCDFVPETGPRITSGARVKVASCAGQVPAKFRALILAKQTQLPGSHLESRRSLQVCGLINANRCTVRTALSFPTSPTPEGQGGADLVCGFVGYKWIRREFKERRP